MSEPIEVATPPLRSKHISDDFSLSRFKTCVLCKTRIATGTNVKISLISNKNLIRVECTSCRQATEGPQELAEETGPRLAEILGVAQNQGTWKARWDMLSQRKNAIWGSWSGYAISAKRKRHREKLETTKSIPRCPKCGSAMRVVEPSSGDKWKAFWGCTLYGSTGCRGTAKYH